MLRQIQDNLHAAMATLWSSLAKLGHRGETLEDLERNGEALVESSASFVRQVSNFENKAVAASGYSFIRLSAYSSFVYSSLRSS